MNMYPADEQRISDVERGLSCRAVVPIPPGESPGVGDAILFAQAQSTVGREMSYVKGGDSVRVLLTDVIALDESDPVTGQALFLLTWEPLGQLMPNPAAKRTVKSHGSHRRV